MELRQLEYFMAICEEMHFTKTAEKLRIGQPTLSYQVKALEDELGVRLFDRLGKKIAITEAGKILQEYCNKVFDNLKNANEQLEELQKIKRGKLVIGVLPGGLSHIASMFLIAFHEKYPDIQIQIIISVDVTEKVKHNEIDFALTLTPPADESFTYIPLYEDEYFLIVRTDHAWAEREVIEFKEIMDIPIILSPQSHLFRQSLEGMCLSLGIEFHPIIESTDSRLMVSLVKGGVGAAIISCTLFSQENEGLLKAIRIKNPTVKREVTVIHHKQKYIGTAARGFIELLIKFMEGKRSTMEKQCIKIFQ